jgi:hypothetical protein
MNSCPGEGRSPKWPQSRSPPAEQASLYTVTCPWHSTQSTCPVFLSNKLEAALYRVIWKNADNWLDQVIADDSQRKAGERGVCRPWSKTEARTAHWERGCFVPKARPYCLCSCPWFQPFPVRMVLLIFLLTLFLVTLWALVQLQVFCFSFLHCVLWFIISFMMYILSFSF